MAQEAYPLTKDERWEAWSKNSFEYFQKMASAFSFIPQVPETVKKRFETVSKLILHSYFEYEFLDVALERALFTFEMSLRIRYEEIHGSKPIDKKGKDWDLFSLIRWASGQGLFEMNESSVQSLRDLRNVAAHPKEPQLFGHLSLHGIHKIVEIINGLYEDVEVRKARQQEEARIQALLEEHLKNGGELDLENARLIIFKASLLYFDNKSASPKYYFLFWPIFDPSPKDNSVKICEPIVYESREWELTDGVFRFRSETDGRELKLRRITNSENALRYEKWKKDFEASDFPLTFELNHQIGEIRAEIVKQVSHI